MIIQFENASWMTAKYPDPEKIRQIQYTPRTVLHGWEDILILICSVLYGKKNTPMRAHQFLFYYFILSFNDAEKEQNFALFVNRLTRL